jgi:hypothetical protein
MKILALKLTLLLPLAFFSQLYSAPDEYVKLTGKVTVTKESDAWIKATVPFGIVMHPKAQTYSRSKPTTIEEVINLEYLDNVKVKIYLCFSNEYKKKTLRSSTIQDISFYQYYGAEVDYLTVKIDRNTKNAYFLFPAPLAERDGFYKGGFAKLVGHAVEISQNGVPFELTITDSILFESKGRKITDPVILGKFKAQAVEKSEANKGLLLPAHLVNQNYLDPTTVVKQKTESNY